MSKVVVLGGGFGGQTAAKMLEKHAPGAEVTVVDKSDAVTVGALFHFAALERMEDSNIPVSLDKARAATVLCKTSVLGVDTSKKEVSVQTEGQAARTISYDYLIVAVGIAGVPSLLPAGVAEVAPDLMNYAHVGRVRELAKGIKSGDKVGIVIPDVPYKCPPAPYEFAMLLDDYLKRKGVEKVEVSVYHCEDKGMVPVVKLMTGRTDIKFKGGYKLVGLKDAKELEFENGVTEAVDTLFCVYPQRPPAFIKDIAGVKANPKGYLVADCHTLETQQKNVFVVGDCGGLMIPDEPAPRGHPKAGQFAYEQAECVGKIIGARMTGNDDSGIKQSGVGECYLEVSHSEGVHIINDCGLRGPPKLTLSEVSSVHAEGKKNWINNHLSNWFGEDATLSFN